MSKSQILRALVNERLTAAAEEIFALFERTIAEYEEEVCRSKEENQRKQELLDSMLSPSKSPGSGLYQDPPQTPRIKEEPEEPSVKQEEHTLLVQVSVGVPESSAVCVMTEESSLLQQRQTELREETQGEDISPKPHLHSSDTDNNEDWRAPLSCSAAQMETDADGELYNQVQKGQRLRALVKEIFVLFERTIAEYEEEVCRSKEKNQRRQELLDSMLSPSKSPGPSLDQDPPQTQWIKEEPEELSVQQEEHTHLVQGEDISAEPHLHSETEGDTEHSSDTDDEDWRTLFNCAAAQMETDADGDHYNQFQNSDLSLKYKSAPETSATVNKEDMSGTAEGAEGKKHQCFVCQKRFGTSRNLQRHSIIHTGEKPFSCSTCQKTFNRKANLGTHEKIHAKKLFSCSTCKRSFTTKSNLEKHAKIHLGERLYSCLICEKTFAYKSDLNKHVRTHTGERPYSCPRCEKTFSRKDILDVHERTHTGEKPYSCSTCERSFSHKCNFVKHVRTHTGERPYSCSTCERSFSQKSNLVKHVRTHTGERPYSCLVCEKTFSENSSLTKHVRTHTGEKPYSCSMCEKTFSDSSYFIKHVRMHTGERPYSCSTCEKSFALKSNLDKHVRTHTGERPYSCSICNKRFTRVYDLNMHMRIHRKECD